MIDTNGYRLNVGMVIYNKNEQVLWAKRTGQHSWQFPQGGVYTNETTQTAMYRELFEEVGLTQADVNIVSESHHWVKYKLPLGLVRWHIKPLCIGQKQKWYLLKLLCNEKAININIKKSQSPEFDSWRWVSYWYPMRHVVSFKKCAYRQMMTEFSRKLFTL
ncbi:RNA pyrophosphohydrolase [Candidatus Erwinia haradaeae]|uniref:RNA pyrophosphohydrolase n=1 Tax=Candidatus Erwinia haradaeae TaxID=1922217 RepID=A0A451DAP2_9GAMM|nr:RNA pyrophosphohydrolase [Candidatus Erwinia haradaeae]VFP83414.1 RNA pyrophosphohydrolase [Candidatus Erwinia haradaeae]